MLSMLLCVWMVIEAAIPLVIPPSITIGYPTGFL